MPQSIVCHIPGQQGWKDISKCAAIRECLEAGNGISFNPNTGVISFAPGDEGDILYFNGLIWTTLPIGTAGQVLAVNGGGDAPVWTTPFSGFTITDGTTSQPIANGNTITFSDGDGLRVVVSATDTVTVDIDPAGELQGLTTGNTGNILYHNGTNWLTLVPGSNGDVLTLATGTPVWQAPVAGASTLVMNIPIENPVAGEKIEIMIPPVGSSMVISGVSGVANHNGAGSLTFNLAFGPNRSLAGTNVYGANQTISSNTTRQNFNTFANAAIGDNILWVNIPTVTNIVDQVTISIYYTL